MLMRLCGFLRTARLLMAASASSTALLACNSSLPEGLSDKPCDDNGHCVAGYFCDPSTNLCISASPLDGGANLVAHDAGIQSDASPVTGGEKSPDAGSRPPAMPHDSTPPGRCLNIQNDPKHCGDCKTKCAKEEHCIAGACERARESSEER
jgi:hypothetical protein